MNPLARVLRKLRSEGVPGLLRAATVRLRMRLASRTKQGTERYAAMQKAYYESFSPNDQHALKEVVIGNYDAHERYPYEQYLLDRVGDTRSRAALDFGCGPGRMIRRLGPRFGRVDGVDISAKLIEACRDWTKDLPSPPRLYVNDGASLAGIPDSEYDFVYCTISFHHIASYDVRFCLLREFHRVLKPGGHLALQMVYTDQPRKVWQRHVNWLDSANDAMGTNSQCDVRITPDNLPDVERSLGSIGFVEFSHRMAPMPHELPDATGWIFLYARKPGTT